MSLDRELEQFFKLLLKWNQTHNLVSRETTDLWARHIEDSLQLVPLVPSRISRSVDLGSGGGLPAIPLAIALRHCLRVTMVEPIAKKAAFLRTAIRDLKLDAEVYQCRAEQLDSRETFDLITSRALAPLENLFRLGLPLLAPDGLLLLHKGKNFRSEVDSAADMFQFDMLIHPSTVDPQGVVLEISNLAAKSAA